jgi:hypothetical protein
VKSNLQHRLQVARLSERCALSTKVKQCMPWCQRTKKIAGRTAHVSRSRRHPKFHLAFGPVTRDGGACVCEDSRCTHGHRKLPSKAESCGASATSRRQVVPACAARHHACSSQVQLQDLCAQAGLHNTANQKTRGVLLVSALRLHWVIFMASKAQLELALLADWEQGRTKQPCVRGTSIMGKGHDPRQRMEATVRQYCHPLNPRCHLSGTPAASYTRPALGR